MEATYLRVSLLSVNEIYSTNGKTLARWKRRRLELGVGGRTGKLGRIPDEEDGGIVPNLRFVSLNYIYARCHLRSNPRTQSLQACVRQEVVITLKLGR